MDLNCFQEIRRTAWCKSTAQPGSAEQAEERRQRELVKPNEKAKQSEHQSARIEARFARRNHSSSNARQPALAASRLAMSTIQKSFRRSCWCLRTISRRQRRIRLRAVALPIARVVIRPARHGPAFFIASTLSVINLPRSA
jgi:hypothetical protein